MIAQYLYCSGTTAPRDKWPGHGTAGENAAFGRRCHVRVLEIRASSLRTLVYVDGFNLYFGCLRGASDCRWLDVEALVTFICRAQNPKAEVVGVKYFSAMIDPKLSPRGVDSVIAQRDYWLALKAHSTCLTIIEGGYFIVSGNYHRNQKPINLTQRVEVLRPEEKQTDVNIGLHMLADATDGLCEQQILFTNDSDCAPVLSMIRERHPDMMLGVVAPVLENGKSRRSSVELRKSSNWTRQTIDRVALEASQLPDSVKSSKRNIRKPEHWD